MERVVALLLCVVLSVCLSSTLIRAEPMVEMDSGSITVRLACDEAKSVFQQSFVEEHKSDIVKALKCQANELESLPGQWKPKTTFNIKPECGEGSQIYCSKDFGEIIGTTRTAPSAE